MIWRFGRPASLIGAVLLLAACAGDNAVVQGPPASDQPDYPAGFTDGCSTAQAKGSKIPEKPHRNQTLYDQSEGYRAGWRAGYGSCGGDDPLRR